MVCPACPAIGCFGGLIGGYLGINPPKSTKGRIVSGVITAAMTCATVIAIKLLFGITICDGKGNFSLKNILRVSAITFLIGIIYSIFVNMLLTKFVFPPEKPVPQTVPPPAVPKACCCKNKTPEEVV